MIINNININIKRFSSGELKLLHDDFVAFAPNGTVDILYQGQESVFELFLICKFFEDNNIKINLTLAYLPYQRMDHKNGHEAPTLEYVAQFFNSLNIDSLQICEPHCDISNFKNAKKVDIVGKIFEDVCKKVGFNQDTDYLIFTDKGAKQRYGHLGKNHIYFEKQRSLKTGLIASHKMVGNLPSNAKAILLDDIISSGDTICSCLSLIDNNIYVVCGHYEKNKYNKRLFENKKIINIFASNSLTKHSNNKLKLYKIENLIKNWQKNKFGEYFYGKKRN